VEPRHDQTGLCGECQISFCVICGDRGAVVWMGKRAMFTSGQQREVWKVDKGRLWWWRRRRKRRIRDFETSKLHALYIVLSLPLTDSVACYVPIYRFVLANKSSPHSIKIGHSNWSFALPAEKDLVLYYISMSVDSVVVVGTPRFYSTTLRLTMP